MNQYIPLLVLHLNENVKMNEELFCREIADWINGEAFAHNDDPTVLYKNHHDLYDFIREYGEDVDETYMGRDADGEKIYHTFNPLTNWHERIRKELVANGYYDRLQKKEKTA